MSTKTGSANGTLDELAGRLGALLAQCEHDTRYSSKLIDTIRHPAFREIVAMGEKVVPLLLASVERGPSRWAPVLALEEIMHVSPPPQDDAAWIAWGREQGIRW